MLRPATLDRERHGHARILRDAAERAGIPTRVVAGDTWPHEIGAEIEEDAALFPWLCLPIGGEVFFYRHHSLSRGQFSTGPTAPINGAAHAIARDKQATGQRLAAAGIPTTPGRTFAADDRAGALLYAARCRGELCIKPNTGSLGDLVFPALRTAEEIDEAFRAVAACYDTVLVERSVPGQIWRFFWIDPDVVAVKHSRPASVVGDGHRTVAELMAAKNRERATRALVGHFPIGDGHACAFMLGRQGLTPHSVPAAGRRVFLHPLSNAQTGADGVARPEAVHPSYTAAVKRACAALPELRVAGVDVAIRDPARPAMAEDTFAVLEINSSPGLLQHHFPWEGTPRDVAGALVAFLCRIATAIEPTKDSLSVTP
ncbi:hypothetical protein [Azospirillum halopraeferens]|uniref:hypothetical protein n=1 Tax=Azospirillum halopraeferens TaxID=34010 RepID=UPI000405E35D|nr:hypothetical protein [Azospirillum halopraeferens]